MEKKDDPMDYPIEKDKSFWQVSISLPKDSSDVFQEFMTKSGALGFHEVLYEEGKTDNLNNDSTVHYYYFAINFPVRAFIPMALAMLKSPDADFQIQEVFYRDFLKSMEETFMPLKITKDLWIVPPWKINESLPENGSAQKLIINPAFAFGTGRHATTQLALEIMQNLDLKDKSILEIGSGSGVLVIYALILGAKKAVGIEVEKLAVESSLENLAINQKHHGFSGTGEIYEDDFSWIERNPEYQYDLFISNILPDIFYKNEKNFFEGLKNASRWIISGVIVEKKDEFIAWLSQRVEIQNIRSNEKDGWLVFYNF